jgi:hypothetical protein
VCVVLLFCFLAFNFFKKILVDCDVVDIIH